MKTINLAILNSLSPYLYKTYIISDSPNNDPNFDFISIHNRLTYIAEGETAYLIGGKKFTATRGTAVYIPPLTSVYLPIDKQHTCKKLGISFNFFYNKKKLLLKNTNTASFYRAREFYKKNRDEFILKNLPPLTLLAASDQLLYENTFQSVNEQFKNNPAENMLMIKSGIIRLIALILRNHTPKDLKSEPIKAWKNIEKAMACINSFYHRRDLDLKAIGTAAGLSESYLHRLFKAQIGVSVHNYLNRIRIENAKKLMMESGKNFTEIASLTGFNDVYTFSRIFKKQTGMRPSDFFNNGFET